MAIGLVPRWGHRRIFEKPTKRVAVINSGANEGINNSSKEREDTIQMMARIIVVKKEEKTQFK